uniref:Uncharacterized protein n=1 Tax=Tetraselmis sp. GSL018 TaxID=582737 RepID=A0A061R8J9_9CHLO
MNYIKRSKYQTGRTAVCKGVEKVICGAGSPNHLFINLQA